MGGARPWLTVVTVVRNDQVGLSKTLASLAPANLQGVQVLVLDGSDDPDTTRSIVERAGVAGVDLAWERPHGIYPAMNAGLALARGTYVYFLNAGDALHSVESLDRVRNALSSADDVEWLVARVQFIDSAGRRSIPPQLDYPRERNRAFAAGHFPPHQGTVCRTSAIRALGGFDESYAISADYALMLRLAQKADPVLLDAVLADFEVGGASSLQWRRSVLEFHRARREVLELDALASLEEWARTARQLARLALFHWGVIPLRRLTRS